MHFSHPDAANSLGKFSSAFIGRTRFGGNNEVREKEDSRPCNEAAKRCSFLAGAQNQLMVAVISLVTIMGASAQDAASPPNLVPFSEFTQSIRGVQASTVMAASRAMVTNNATVEEMRQHLLSLYEGVSVSHSFVLGASCQ
jgi:hypothetical protein